MAAVQSAVAPEYPSSAFVHLFEWSWADVARECEEWLGPKGFAAVQISPPNEHIQGDAWWTRYQPVTYNLTSRSGDERSFADMVRRCNKAGVGIYADAVFNHIASGSGTGIAGNPYGNRTTPIYTQEDMHHNAGDLSKNCGVSNYQDKHNVQYCDLVGLPDLCTSCDKVQERVSAYISRMERMGVAGIRVDAAKHQDAGELGQLLARAAGGLYIFQEVISGENEGVRPEMYASLGQVTEFEYARQLALNFIVQGKLQYLGTFGEAWGFMPAADAVVFIDNHDTQRGEAALTYRSGRLYELATVFMLAHPYGYPKVMSSYAFQSHDQGPPKTPVHGEGGLRQMTGAPTRRRGLRPVAALREPGVACGARPGMQEGAPWVCEHRWASVANMVAWRRSGGTSPVGLFQAPGGDTIAFCRGQAACVALNRQELATWSTTVKFSVPPGKYCNIIESDDVSDCPTVEVARDGSARLEVPPLGAVAVHVGKRRPIGGQPQANAVSISI